MALTTQIPGLYLLTDEKKGRAVYCAEAISQGSIIEVCPVIVLSAADTAKIHTTELHDYYFVWDIDAGTSAISLGYGSIYNHSDSPNAEFELIKDSMEIRFYALRDIEPSEEITINYIATKEEGIELWFDPA